MPVSVLFFFFFWIFDIGCVYVLHSSPHLLALSLLSEISEITGFVAEFVYEHPLIASVMQSLVLINLLLLMGCIFFLFSPGNFFFLVNRVFLGTGFLRISFK